MAASDGPLAQRKVETRERRFGERSNLIRSQTDSATNAGRLDKVQPSRIVEVALVAR